MQFLFLLNSYAPAYASLARRVASYKQNKAGGLFEPQGASDVTVKLLRSIAVDSRIYLEFKLDS